MRIHLLPAMLVFLSACGTGVGLAEPLPPNSIAGPTKPQSGWRTDFHEAEAEARRLGLPLLVHFYAEWCGPCHRMEQEFLHSPALYRQLEGRFIAVKIDSDQHPELVQKFGIDSLPSDLFLDVNGKILARSSAYQDAQAYYSRLAQVDARVAHSRKIQIAGTGTSSAGKTGSSGGGDFSKPSAPKPELREPNANSPGPSRVADDSVPVKRSKWVLGLRGFSPVALSKNRRWLKGDPRFAGEHKGIVYHLASAAELEEFRSDPDRYAPQLQGCDPVVLEERDRAIVGDTRYGVFYDTGLYFFVNTETRARFKAAPHQYTRTKHVLNLNKIEQTELR